MEGRGRAAFTASLVILSGGLLAVGLAAGDLLDHLPDRIVPGSAGHPLELPTVSLDCLGEQRSSGVIDYAAVPTSDTPRDYITRYLSRPELARQGVGPESPVSLYFDHTEQGRASKAVAVLETRRGSPGMILRFQKDPDYGWHMELTEECA